METLYYDSRLGIRCRKFSPGFGRQTSGHQTMHEWPTTRQAYPLFTGTTSAIRTRTESLSQLATHWQPQRFTIASFREPQGLLFPTRGNTGLDTHTSWQDVRNGDRCIWFQRGPALVMSAPYAIFWGFSAFPLILNWLYTILYTTVSTGKGIASSLRSHHKDQFS